MYLLRRDKDDFAYVAANYDGQEFILSRLDGLLGSDLHCLKKSNRCLDFLARNVMFKRTANTTAPSIDLFITAHTIIKTEQPHLMDKYATVDLLRNSIRSGNIDLVRYAFENFKIARYPQLDDHLVHLACVIGSVEIVKYLASKHRISSTIYVHFDQVAYNGNIDIFRYYSQCPKVESSMHFDTYDYNEFERKDVHQFSSKRNTITPNTLTQAARGGHYDLVQYLHRNHREGGGPMTLLSAVGSNSLDTVKYVIEHNIGKASDHIVEALIHCIKTTSSIDIITYMNDLVAATNLLDPIFSIQMFQGNHHLSKHFTTTSKFYLQHPRNKWEFPSDNTAVIHLMDLFKVKSRVPKLSFTTIVAS
eukprot:gene3747-4321_t